MNYLYENEERPCRCEFVHSWLDAHLKYFPPPPPEPKLITRMCQYTFGPSPIYYFYSEPIYFPEPPKNIQLPYIMPAPHRISPLRPVYDTFVMPS